MPHSCATVRTRLNGKNKIRSTLPMKLAVAILVLTLPARARAIFSPNPPPQATCASQPPPASTSPASSPARAIRVGFSHMDGAADSFTASAKMSSASSGTHTIFATFRSLAAPTGSIQRQLGRRCQSGSATYQPADLRSEKRQAIQQQRMQDVLAQRFALVRHFEIRQLPVYNLVLAKGGSKLKPTSATRCRQRLNSRNGGTGQRE